MEPIGITIAQYKDRKLIKQNLLRHAGNVPTVHSDGNPSFRYVLFCGKHGMSMTVQKPNDRMADWFLQHPTDWCQSCCVEKDNA